MATENNNNGGLYFIVGALLVTVVVLGFMFINTDDGEVTIEPAAGIEQAADSVKESTSEIKLNIDGNGVSGSTTQTSE